MAKEFSARPSAIVGVRNSLLAFQIDRAVWVFGTSVVADMDQAESEISERDPKAKSATLRAARLAVFNKYMNDGTEHAEKDRPTPGRFADPRAMMQAGTSGR
jgi:hypothetical protein